MIDATTLMFQEILRRWQGPKWSKSQILRIWGGWAIRYEGVCMLNAATLRVLGYIPR